MAPGREVANAVHVEDVPLDFFDGDRPVGFERDGVVRAELDAVRLRRVAALDAHGVALAVVVDVLDSQSQPPDALGLGGARAFVAAAAGDLAEGHRVDVVVDADEVYTCHMSSGLSGTRRT